MPANSPEPLDYRMEQRPPLAGARYWIIITFVWTIGLASWVIWLTMFILLFNRFLG